MRFPEMGKKISKMFCLMSCNALLTCHFSREFYTGYQNILIDATWIFRREGRESSTENTVKLQSVIIFKPWEIKAPNKIIYKFKNYWTSSSKNQVERGQKGMCIHLNLLMCPHSFEEPEALVFFFSSFWGHFLKYYHSTFLLNLPPTFVHGL